MKTQLTNYFNPLTYEELEKLIKTTDETLAFGVVRVPVKKFSAAELWNIQRRHTSLGQRRRFV